MQCVMTDRCYSLEDRFVSFIKLFADTWSGLIGVIETFASVKKFVQFVDVTCGAEARPSWTCIYQLNQGSRKENLLNAIVTHAVRSKKSPYCSCTGVQGADMLIHWKLTGDGYPECFDAAVTFNVLLGWRTWVQNNIKFLSGFKRRSVFDGARFGLAWGRVLSTNDEDVSSAFIDSLKWYFSIVATNKFILILKSEARECILCCTTVKTEFCLNINITSSNLPSKVYMQSS